MMTMAYLFKVNNNNTSNSKYFTQKYRKLRDSIFKLLCFFLGSIIGMDSE